MASKYWIKLYHEILSDPKMGRMPDHLWRRSIELFLLAGEFDQGGYLPPLEDMAWKLHESEETLLADLCNLEPLNIVIETPHGWMVVHFAERQDAETNAERQKKYRDSKRPGNGKSNESVTNPETNSHADIDIDIDKEIDKDKENLLTDPANAEGFSLPTLTPEELQQSEAEQQISGLYGAFITGFGRDAKSSEVDYWLRQLSELHQEGITPEDIAQAFAQLAGGYTITSPKSIRNTALSCMKKRKNGGGKSSSAGPRDKRDGGKDGIRFDNLGGAG